MRIPRLDNSTLFSQAHTDEGGEGADLPESTILDIYLPDGSIGEESELIRRLERCVYHCPYYQVSNCIEIQIMTRSYQLSARSFHLQLPMISSQIKW